MMIVGAGVLIGLVVPAITRDAQIRVVADGLLTELIGALITFILIEYVWSKNEKYSSLFDEFDTKRRYILEYQTQIVNERNRRTLDIASSCSQIRINLLTRSQKLSDDEYDRINQAINVLKNELSMAVQESSHLLKDLSQKEKELEEIRIKLKHLN